MSIPAVEFKNQALILPVQSILYLISVEYNILRSNHNNGDGNKRGPEDKRRKPNKKRKTK